MAAERVGEPRGPGARLAAGTALGVLLGAACGGGDVTTLTSAETEDSELEPQPVAEQSRTFSVLSAPESLDAVCRLIGVSSVSGSGSGDREACTEVVDECRSNVAGVAPAASPATDPGLPVADLETLLGCPLTLSQLDACIGTALERGIEEYGSAIGCEMPALPAVDLLELFVSPACIVVVLQCPELIASIAAPPAQAPRANDPR